MKNMINLLFKKRNEQVVLEPAGFHTVEPPERPGFIDWCEQVNVSLLAPKNQSTFIRVGDKTRVVDLHNL